MRYLNDSGANQCGLRCKKTSLRGVLSGGKWDLVPGHQTGTGSQWALSRLGFRDEYFWAYNKKYFDEKGDSRVPGSRPFDELYTLAKQAEGLVTAPGSYGCGRAEGPGTGRRSIPGYMTTFTNAGAKDFEVKDGKLVSASFSTKPLAIEITKKMGAIW